MKFIFYHPVHFEDWDWRNSIEKGIGGSETSQVEMSWRLARRGHECINYAPIPKDCPGEWRGTKWYRFEEADFTQDGIWILYRCPEVLDKFKNKTSKQKAWLMMQDEDYPSWNEKRAKIVNKVLPLCGVHAKTVVNRHPELNGKMWVTSNGIKMELIREIEQKNIIRDHKKIIYASSPDRGLKYVLESFKKIREFVPDAQLHAFYGFNNINKLIEFNPEFKHFQKLKDEIEILMKQPGVYFRGRVTQKQLYQEWLSAGIWLYQTNFTETSCITSMEAQALGAIPITNPIWALSENVMHGIFIDGDAWGDPLTKAKYVAETVRLLTNPKLQQEIRKEMMPKAQWRFNWERWVDQWEAWIYNFHDHGLWVSQYNFQLKYAKGKILNIGCDLDLAEIKKLGNVINLDILKISPITNTPTKADIIADARNLTVDLVGQFDTVILGDILEHYHKLDIIKILTNAKKCLKENGQIIITAPEDYRSITEQHEMATQPYTLDGGSSTHDYPLTKDQLETFFEKVGLKVKLYQPIDYTQFLGHGYVIRT